MRNEVPVRNRIDHTFSRLKKSKGKALIAYVTAGFPTKASFPKLVHLVEDSGADLLEVGVPFSDPIADGPTIQHASQVALQNGVTLSWILKSVHHLRRQGVTLPLVFMSYCNPIHAMGLDAFFKRAKAVGVDGLIIPDLIPEEAGPYEHLARKNGIDLIYLVSPTTPRQRIGQVAQKTHGFLYAVSLTGVTGVRKAMPAEVAKYLKWVQSASHKPVAVGFGLTTPDQVRAISRHADGVIVGSALVRMIEKSKKTQFAGAARFIRSLKGALDAH
jgi:tryptophan synthase alpha chain